jgi:hypothetical protein
MPCPSGSPTRRIAIAFAVTAIRIGGSISGAFGNNLGHQPTVNDAKLLAWSGRPRAAIALDEPLSTLLRVFSEMPVLPFQGAGEVCIDSCVAAVIHVALLPLTGNHRTTIAAQNRARCF